MKKKISSSKSVKKYELGGYFGSKDDKDKKKKVGATQDRKTGVYDYIDKYNTPAGVRYYQGSSPNLSTAMKIADYKGRTQSSDSIPSSKIKLKSGGSVKTKTTKKKK